MSASSDNGTVDSIFKWGDFADLNSFEVRRLQSGRYLVIAGHGPRPQRTYTSIVLGGDALIALSTALEMALDADCGRHGGGPTDG